MNLKKAIVIGVVGYAVFALTLVGFSRVSQNKPNTEVTEPLLQPPQEAARDLTKDKKVKVKTINVEANQVIYLNVPIVDETVNMAIEAIKQADESGASEIYLVLNSPGGSVLDGARLVSFIKYSGLTVHTVCEGICASMAAQIHQVGATRLMTPGSVLMFHPASGGVQGTMDQMSHQLGAFSRLVDRLDMEVAKRAGLDYKEYKNRLESEYWLESQDAINDGFADGLVLLNLKQRGGYDMSRTVDKLGLKITAPTVDIRTRGNFYR